ncbi:MAG: pentapeptide repeat-containing protein [Rivularia sp. (in: cyanobacteria)]
MNGDEFFERYEAGLRDVNLTGAILTDTFFGEPCFRRVNLTGVDLSEADILWIEHDSYIKEVTFCNTLMPDGTIRNDHCT